jgi:hypothetical protein
MDVNRIPGRLTTANAGVAQSNLPNDYCKRYPCLPVEKLVYVAPASKNTLNFATGGFIVGLIAGFFFRKGRGSS